METTLPRQGKALSRMLRLRQAPPASLLLEGGSEAEREAAALHWAIVITSYSIHYTKLYD